MVAIKIQSLEDIVGAYLKTLGFAGKALEAGVRKLTAEYGEKLSKDDVPAALDNLIGEAAEKIFTETFWNKEQKIAMLKLCYVCHKGAEKWGMAALLKAEADPAAVEELRSLKLLTAPEYCPSKMQAQKIEVPQPQKLLCKLMFGKGQKNG